MPRLARNGRVERISNSQHLAPSENYAQTDFDLKWQGRDPTLKGIRDARETMVEILGSGYASAQIQLTRPLK